MVYEGNELNHAFGLCHYKQYLFWNEYRGGSIFKLDTSTSTVTLLRNERPPLFEIRVYDAHQQQGNFPGDTWWVTPQPMGNTFNSVISTSRSVITHATKSYHFILYL